MASSCAQIRNDLISCIIASPCFQLHPLKDADQHGKAVQDCLTNHLDELPEACRFQRQAFFECKRAMVSLYAARQISDVYDLIAGYEETIQR